MRPALFLDLDHTLIRPLGGRVFPKDIHDWEFMPGVLFQIGPYMERGEMVIIISNQGGIEAGFQTEEEVNTKLRHILEHMIFGVGTTSNATEHEDSQKPTAFYYCPTNDKAHPDRKPNPGMIFHASLDFDIDLPNSLFVGDMDTDREAAEAAGVPFLHIDDFLARTTD